MPRSGIVSETDLVTAAVEIYEQEPLLSGHVLAEIPKLFPTTHIAGVTTESNERVSTLIAQRISDAVSAIN